VDVKQTDRTAVAFAPTGLEALALARMRFSDRVNDLFEAELELLGSDFDLAADDLLGKPFGVSLRTAEGERWLHGVVAAFRFAGARGRLARFEATLRPWFWLLGLRKNCRIFQQKSAPEIVREIVEEAGFSADLDLSGLSETYEPREYCVQYNESDLDFVRRLLEDEGVNFHFVFEENRHVLALTDWNDAFKPADGYADIPYYPQDGQQRREREHVFEWRASRTVAPGAAALCDYDFSAPKKDLRSVSVEAQSCAHGDLEVFEWPGGYFDLSPGDRRSRVRREELQARRDVAEGRANARGLDAGATFELVNFPRSDQNRAYLVLEAVHEFEASGFQTGGESERYECAFAVSDLARPLRPTRATPRPRMHGPQIAIVCGPAGEEIYTDEYGRVKVQFYWDRYGAADENASCWIRVAQPWAGSGWGGQHIPRIGQEVVVEFLEGDPDRPVIVGALYNGDNAPPFALPGAKTQSGLRSNSSKGGGGSNELRFEDAAGEEQIYLHAQRNEDIVVENDATRTVGANRTKNVGADETVTIGANRTESVGVDQSTTIGANETVNIGADSRAAIGANQTVVVGGARAHTIALADNLAVGGAQGVEVGGARAVTVGGLQNHTIGASDTTTVAGSQSFSVGADRQATVGGSDTLSVGESHDVAAGKSVTITAADEIVLTAGDAQIILKKDGSIILKGKDVTVDASGQIAMKSAKDTSVKASGDVVLKGKKVLGN